MERFITDTQSENTNNEGWIYCHSLPDIKNAWVLGFSEPDKLPTTAGQVYEQYETAPDEVYAVYSKDAKTFMTLLHNIDIGKKVTPANSAASSIDHEVRLLDSDSDVDLCLTYMKEMSGQKALDIFPTQEWG